MDRIHYKSQIKDQSGYGEAIETIYESDDGEMIAVSENGEYSSRINFCPFCGKAAKTQNRAADNRSELID